MSNSRGKNWFRFAWHPTEDEFLLWLDGEASEKQAEKIRAHLESCWACRNQREKFDRAISTFMDYCLVEASDGLPPAASQQFAEQLRHAATTQPTPSLLTRCLTRCGQSLMQYRLRWLTAMAMLLLCAFGISRLIWTPPVSAGELLQRATQAEVAALQRVREPVVYCKIQIKRRDRREAVLWESWNDAQRQRLRQRVADAEGTRLSRAQESSSSALLTEVDAILRANHFDAQHPLSATAFAAWRDHLSALTEHVTTTPDAWKLTTVTAAPYQMNAIIEATLTVRPSDWHAVALQLQVQGEQGIQTYELSETAYEVLPREALTAFSDLAAPAPVASVSATPARVAATASPSLAPTLAAAPSAAALQEAEVAALYALHQLQADLGEQIEVLREGNRQIVVRGLVQTATRKEQLIQSLRLIPLVSPHIQTIDEAVQQAQRTTRPPADNEPVIIANETSVTSTSAAPTVNPFQQKLTEHFGGHKGMSEAERAEVNARVSQFYNAIEADASAAMSEAWALRRLQERFAAPAGTELEAASRQRLEEMQGNHLARLRLRSRNLQARLRPLLVSLAGEAPTVPQAIESTRPAQIQAVFRAIEQTSRLTDQLIAGNAAALSQIARELLMQFVRLDAALAALDKK